MNAATLELTAFDNLPDDAVLRVIPIEGGAPPERAKALLAVFEALLGQWRADGKIANGAAMFAANDYLLLVAYELTGGDLSGCTKDQLTHLILDQEEVLGRRMLNAPRMAVWNGDGVDFLAQGEFRERRSTGAISAETSVVDHLVQTVGDARSGRLLTTVGESWYNRVGGLNGRTKRKAPAGCGGL